MDDVKNYDELLYPILHNEGEISGFLDAVFSFLSRRTDFFQLQQTGNLKTAGLPLGAAENLVKESFCKYYRQSQKTDSVEEDNLGDQEVPISDVIEEVTDIVSHEEVVIEEASEQSPSSGEKCEEKIYTSDSQCYNGAEYTNYSWSQSIKDLDVLVKVPPEISSGKKVKVHLQQSELKVEVENEDLWEVLAEGNLRYDISVEESFWTLVPHKHVHICLEKKMERWWDALLESEPKIDVRNIDACQPYEDLDEESQAKIQELMYNEQQKRLGKLTSEQEKIANALKGAWDLEGSPFRGTPYDQNVALSASSTNSSSFPVLPN